MALHLTSCESKREPGFSRSECLDLVRRIRFGELIVLDEGDSIEWGDDGPRLSSKVNDYYADIICAALRAYAS